METYDYGVSLVNQTIDYDELGNEIPTETHTNVLCRLSSIGSREFYEASAQGLKPEVEFVIHAFEYNHEQLVDFEGVRYTVIRTYRTNQEEVELTCQRAVGE